MSIQRVMGFVHGSYSERQGMCDFHHTRFFLELHLCLVTGSTLRVGLSAGYGVFTLSRVKPSSDIRVLLALAVGDQKERAG